MEYLISLPGEECTTTTILQELKNVKFGRIKNVESSSGRMYFGIDLYF